MFVLGLILILLAAFGLFSAIGGGANDQANFDVGTLHVDLSTMSVFLLGAATLLIFVIGLELVRSGAQRAKRRRKDTKELNRLSERLQEHDAEKRQDTPADPE